MSICSYWCQSIFGDGAACSCGAAPSTPETTKILDPAALVEKLNRGQMWSEDLKSAFGYLAQKCGELQDEIARLRGPSTPGAADPATRIIAAWGEYKSAAAEAERTTSYSDGFAAGDAWGRFEDLMDSLPRPSRPAEAPEAEQDQDCICATIAGAKKACPIHPTAEPQGARPSQADMLGALHIAQSALQAIEGVLSMGAAPGPEERGEGNA